MRVTPARPAQEQAGAQGGPFDGTPLDSARGWQGGPFDAAQDRRGLKLTKDDGYYREIENVPEVFASPSASGGFDSIEPIVGMAFGMGDRKDSDFGWKFKKHECIRESGEEGTPDDKINGRLRKPGK